MQLKHKATVYNWVEKNNELSVDIFGIISR